jgi:hypothetical protein
MYFWKCWRDTRSFFVVFLIIAAIVMPVAAMVCLGTHLVADFGASAFSATFGLILMAVALGLGAIGAIHEFAENSTLAVHETAQPLVFCLGWLGCRVCRTAGRCYCKFRRGLVNSLPLQQESISLGTFRSHAGTYSLGPLNFLSVGLLPNLLPNHFVA